MKRYREAEIVHGRVAMLATVEYVVKHKEIFHSSVKAPCAIDHLAQIPNIFWIALVVAIGAAEQQRATIGWVEPNRNEIDNPGMLRSEYVPGDLGFDPLNFKPYYVEELWDMQTKELQNGRLAMIGIVGMVAQEYVTHKPVFDTLFGTAAQAHGVHK
ncbi:MAG: hypothetical protein SGARI_004110 [Bacillariaceae sp.]